MPATVTFQFGFRPDSYWDPADPETAILSGVTGELRRQVIRDFVRGEAAPFIGALNDRYLEDTLSNEDRISLGRLHPQWIGGEYLPRYRRGEVEIARVVLKTATLDVLSIRARRNGRRIRYRVVDEYETTFTLSRQSSTIPLTLRQLIQLVDTASCVDYDDIPINLREMNLEGGTDLDVLEAFVTVSSLFYPELEPYYDLVGQRWAEEKRRESECDKSGLGGQSTS